MSTTPPPAPPSTPTPSAVPRVQVRMYRHGLGDCFLVTLDLGRDEKHVLIDCGTLGSKVTNVKLPDVIDDIDAATGGHLHLVVATHQHADHLSGFSKLTERFSAANSKQPDHVWLAWTEDPKDELAARLGKARDDMGLAVKSSLQAMRATGGDDETANAIDSLLGFFGDTSVALGAAGSAEGATFAAAARNSMDLARNLAKQVTYRSPGDPVIAFDWLPGFRFYVLGPPRDLDALHDTGEHGSEELYALTALTQAALGMGAASATGDDSGVQAPFDRRFRLERTDSAVVAAFGKTYLDPEQSWRSVDTDWLNGASALAIQLDKFTNNTSLVLAIERIADGRVLLFPGDAQEGNWISWHKPEIKWEVPGPDGKTRTVTAADLLNRTVFYKVGHHSSHNATAKARGLELMTSQAELTAFIPVDRAVALGRSPKNTWKMPARQLYRRLLEQCQGRVLRSDIGWAVNVPAGVTGTEEEFIALGTDADWSTWGNFQQAATRVKISEKHIDFVLD